MFTASSLSLIAAACASRAPIAQTPAAAPGPRAQFGAWGVDLGNRDLSVKPGDDFNRYCNGTWFKNTQIPADRATWGSGSILAEQVNSDVKSMIQSIAASGGAPGSNEQKIADFYNAFMDTDAITAKGLAPAKADLDAIAAIRTHAEAWTFVCRPGMQVDFPIGMYVNIDARDPDR
jgi:predicted metalloendopeptidase